MPFASIRTGAGAPRSGITDYAWSEVDQMLFDPVWFESSHQVERELAGIYEFCWP